MLGYIDAGRQAGAQVLIGGQRTLEETGGLYVEPTIFDGVDNAMKIAQEEIFGPVLSVISFDSAEEAVAIANDTPYGLAAAVRTADLSKAHRTAQLRAGSVWVNQYDGGDMTAPFGGFKQSGNGRDKSLHAFDKYTELKATGFSSDGIRRVDVAFTSTLLHSHGGSMKRGPPYGLLSVQLALPHCPLRRITPTGVYAGRTTARDRGSQRVLSWR